MQWWLEAIHWDADDRANNLTGAGVLIAVIDTAIDMTHPDLIGKIVEQYIVEGAEEDLRYEHGTAVAGIICASPSSEDGALGVAVDAKIVSIVISSNAETQLDSLIKGIEFAITRKVDIINISAGIINDNPALRSIINDAYDAGIVIVAASGNDLYGSTLYPAKYANVISVDSVDSNGNKIFSQNDDSVFLPGGNIVTTYSSLAEPKKYVSYTGTSVSVPILTGVIALILEQDPNVRNEDILYYFSGYRRTDFNTIEVLEEFYEIYH